MTQYGPDASRYLIAGAGDRVARPFNLRWLLPLLCRNKVRRWWAVWALSWPLTVAGMLWWGYEVGAGWWPSVAAAAFLVALPGVWGPHVVRPVGVDLPAMACSIVAVAAFEAGWWPLAVALILVSASVKESSPVFAALWVWHPLLLVGLVVPAVAYLVRKPEVDWVTRQPVLKRVHDHPIASSLEHHKGQWRDAWWMVAPWGATLAALYQMSTRTAVVAAVAYSQLLVATDTVRLVQTAAGPWVALVAAQTLPVEWLPVAVVVHAVWWWTPRFQ